MKEVQPDLAKRILYILHQGFVEARHLAQTGRDEQIFDLADALEMLPGELCSWKEDSLEAIRFNLKTYEDKYPEHSFEYLKYLNRQAPPDAF